jgi:hypothetical protein
LRHHLEEHFSRIAAELERLVREARERARGESIEQLNQAARRLQQAAGAEELAATLADAAAAFAGGVAVFRVEGETAIGERIHGANEDAAERFRGLRIPLASAAALAGAVHGHDPVTAAATPNELSAEMVELVGHGAGERVSIFPLASRFPLASPGTETADAERRPDSAFALLYSWGEVQVAALELLSQVAAASWPARETPKTVTSELVQIATGAPRKSWEDLPADEQQVHLRAQRFARVRVAEMRLRHAQEVQAGRAHRDLYRSLQPAIDGARQEFREAFFTPCASMVDYLHLELVRVLANNEIDSLGKDYPGPML